MDRRGFLRILGYGVAGGAGAVAGVSFSGSGPGIETRQRIENSDAARPLGQHLGSHRLIWSVDTDQPLASLTFDDGPDPELTPKVLEILGRYNVLATFNVMGYNALKHGDLLKQTVAGGHEIGNHTWTHLDLAFQDPQETMRQLKRGREVIEEVGGIKTRFFRPPRGELTGAAASTAAELGYDILLWSVSRGPSGVSTMQAVLNHITARLQKGSIVGLHDGLGRSTFDPRSNYAGYLRKRHLVEIDALPGVIENAMASGLRLVTVSELVAAGRPG